MSTSSWSSIADSYPLIAAICAALARKNISQCCLVCRDWNQGFVPFLWRHLRRGLRALPLHLEVPQGRADFARCAQHVRILETYKPCQLDEFPQDLFGNLTTLKVRELSDDGGLFVDLLHQCYQVCTLSMPYFSEVGSAYAERFHSLLRSRVHLQELEIQCRFAIPQAMFCRLLLSCQNLTKLTSASTIYVVPALSPQDTFATHLTQAKRTIQVPFQLRHLSLHLQMKAGDAFLDFLTLCPHIEHLAAPISSNLNAPFVPKLAAALEARTRLLSLDFSGYYKFDDTGLIIRACKGLERFRGSRHPRSPVEMLTALLTTHSRTLTHVTLDEIGLIWTPSGTIQRLLCTCPNLLKFSAQYITSGRRFFNPEEAEGGGGLVSQRHELSPSWVCRRLEKLNVDFQSRITPTAVVSTDTAFDIEFISKALMSQLQMMVLLRELILGRMLQVAGKDDYGTERMIGEYRSQGQEQGSTLLAILSNLRHLNRVYLRNFKGLVLDEDLRAPKRNWKHIAGVPVD
ncbi:hypothetical protein BG004_003873 [Podila humilis]|nr:hypothetical protein BG004_003873 [Podila humilis]